jgi:hypothetical protein
MDGGLSRKCADIAYLCDMGRFFNTAGPCKSDIHYTLEPMGRLFSVRSLVEAQKYFILHAPRQTGKTTTMIAFMEAINKEGKYVAVYANVEPAQALRHDVVLANDVFVNAVAGNGRFFLPKEYWPSDYALSAEKGGERFKEFLNRWCLELSKPLVLFIDEADALIGDALLSLLRQLRSGYALRPKGFPHAVALIGLRDIRDYRIFSDNEKRYVIGGSAFNIKDKSLTMTNFTPEEVRELYGLHTAETGQQFTAEAIDLVYSQTKGQPWLVNALGRELCFEEYKVPDNRTIEAEDVYKAGEILIQRRDTHLDHLADKLSEPRVARVVDIILSSEDFSKLDEIAPDDLQYVIDLGLVVRDKNGVGIANPIYREVVPRELTWVQQTLMRSYEEWYIGDDGRLNMENVLKRFFAFYKEHAEMLSKRGLYTESAYHLAFVAWLQRIVNGGGYIRREYAAGTGFVDVVVEFKGDKFVFELKTERNYVRKEALAQIARYAHRVGVKECYLMVFRPQVTDPKQVGKRSAVQYEGLKVHIIWL